MRRAWRGTPFLFTEQLDGETKLLEPTPLGHRSPLSVAAPRRKGRPATESDPSAKVERTAGQSLCAEAGGGWG